MRRALGIFLLLAASCGGGTPPASTGNYAELTLTARDKVDILFMIDNSPSMSPKQEELRQRFPQLVQTLMLAAANHPVDYHIGVVTSDLGAGPNGVAGSCRPGGDGGRLQALGAAAPSSCLAPVGKNFIDWNELDGTDNLPAGQDLGTTFGCMASVGDVGCGFEMPLESVYRALHDPIPENQDFLRPDAALVVVFLTDEDDCSAPDDTDLFDPASMQYGALASYRCSQFGVVCGDPPALLPAGDSGGALSSCAPATQAQGGKLLDVDKYVQFFTQPSGVKTNPGDVQLVAIAGPDSPVGTVLANVNSSGGVYQTCDTPDGTSCLPMLQHSCIAAMNTQFVGDPAVRLSSVVRSAQSNQITSICDTSYQQAMQQMGSTLIAHERAENCFDAPLAFPPQCTVTVEVMAADGTVATQDLLQCAPGVAHPCWSLTTDGCAATQRFTLTGVDITPSTVARARCLTALTP